MPDNSEELANATRDALRDVSQQPNLCQLLRRKTEIRVLKQVELIDQLKQVSFEFLTLSKTTQAMITRLTTTQAEADDQIMATRLANSRRNDTQEQIEKVQVS